MAINLSLMHDLALILSVFLATLVEAVEALTIVMAAGLGRNWKSARQGTISAFLVLVVVISILGPVMASFPVFVLHLLVGVLSLVFGLQWLRKAILRSSGFKAIHDEEKIFKKEMELAKTATLEKKSFVADWYAFTLSFKAVLLEGIEVAFIVISFGAIQGKIVVASGAALLAVVIVVLAGVFLHKPLARVPENSLKFVVALILTTFGIFWSTEGVGVEWAMADLVLIPIFLSVALLSLILVLVLKKRHALRVEHSMATDANLGRQPQLSGFVGFIYDFIIGDDWLTALAIYSGLVLSAALVSLGYSFELLFVTIVLGATVLRLLSMTNNSKVTV